MQKHPTPATPVDPRIPASTQEILQDRRIAIDRRSADDCTRLWVRFSPHGLDSTQLLRNSDVHGIGSVTDRLPLERMRSFVDSA